MHYMNHRFLKGITCRSQVISMVCLIIGFLSFACEKRTVKEYTGAFYANDCSVSHGGFEWAADYDARMTIKGSRGHLELTLIIGLGDYLEKHEFKITSFEESYERLTFKIQRKRATLIYTEVDSIWSGTYNNHFIGNNSIKESEKIGQLPIEVFKGYKSHFYVEMRFTN